LYALVLGGASSFTDFHAAQMKDLQARVDALSQVIHGREPAVPQLQHFPSSAPRTNLVYPSVDSSKRPRLIVSPMKGVHSRLLELTAHLPRYLEIYNRVCVPSSPFFSKDQVFAIYLKISYPLQYPYTLDLDECMEHIKTAPEVYEVAPLIVTTPADCSCRKTSKMGEYLKILTSVAFAAQMSGHAPLAEDLMLRARSIAPYVRSCSVSR
jgi:hypothetical protein